MTPRPRRFHRTTLVACLLWGAFAGGCAHPLAQRSPWHWDVVRVLTYDQAAAPAQATDARAQPVRHTGFYHLIREWEKSGPAGSDHPPPGEITQVYLEAGESLGFRLNAAGRAVAVYVGREIQIDPAAGIHYVWYREKGGSFTGSNDTLLVLGIIAFTVGIIVLAVSSDNTSFRASF